MIRRDPMWEIGEWVVVLLWKAICLALLATCVFMCQDGQTSELVVGAIYGLFALLAFIFTQPDV